MTEHSVVQLFEPFKPVTDVSIPKGQLSDALVRSSKIENQQQQAADGSATTAEGGKSARLLDSDVQEVLNAPLTTG